MVISGEANVKLLSIFLLVEEVKVGLIMPTPSLLGIPTFGVLALLQVELLVCKITKLL